MKNEFSSRLLAFPKRLVDYFRRGIWSVEPSTLPPARRAVVKTARILTLVFHGFRDDECSLRASSLTFVSMLSIIPVLAISLSLAKAFVSDKMLRDQARDWVHQAVTYVTGEAPAPFAPESIEASGAAPDLEAAAPDLVAPDLAAATQPAVPVAFDGINEARIQELVTNAFDIVDGINFKALGGIGLLALLWACISVIGNIERSFNSVWGVQRERSYVRKFTDYLSVLLLLPFLGIAVSSLPISTVLEHTVGAHGGFLASVLTRPFLMLALLTVWFVFLLRFTPNTHVRAVPGLVGGIVAAVGFSVWMRICLGLQIGVARYSSFFGSFALVPILLFWVYVSWQILLFAAEVSYAVQNTDQCPYEAGWNNASPRARVLLAAALLAALRENIGEKRGGTLALAAFVKSHRVSYRLTVSVARALERRGVFVPVADAPDTYAAGVDLATYSDAALLSDILSDGTPPSALGISTDAPIAKLLP